MKSGSSQTEAEKLLLADKILALEVQIKDAESFPQRLLEEQREREMTLPSIDVLNDAKKRKLFESKQGRAAVHNTKREATKSWLLLILLVIAVVLMVLWAFKSISSTI
jgi:type VI protein secretion system component VasF